MSDLKHLRILLVGLALCGALTGCGYRPLYGDNSNGKSVSTELAALEVTEQRSRSGQLVRNEVLSGVKSGDEGARYRLDMVITEKTVDVAEASAVNVERKRVRLAVDYKLTVLSSGEAVNAGRSFSDVSYDRIGEPVADRQAEASALERAAHELAQDLRIRLAAFFSNRG
jgi:LPS-assembly lipoprotein